MCIEFDRMKLKKNKKSQVEIETERFYDDSKDIIFDILSQVLKVLEESALHLHKLELSRLTKDLAKLICQVL